MSQQVAVMLAGSLDLETPPDVAGVLDVYSDVDENSLYTELIAVVKTSDDARVQVLANLEITN